ncbi:MAG: amidohydrolase family protein [Candidatus Edwardsbacteria bacterium]|nr:amidohydrolase family protein [Candidatus Edwardsbacteria bacterium]MBU1577228.1 amidohydrolase family protein [Candidatus Edwardsbacteria bacterium]MBU2462476.1 amidohydrolase family protein [Candidatus Edwardsbacteria bacterium]MBU2594077.1 amidohydrolase family protein [Candidatus Edwardsbacteria bacterium]
MIDCHSHLSQFDAIGQTGFTLMDWLKNHIYPAEVCLSNKKNAENISQRYFQALLSTGITFTALYTNFNNGVLAARRQAEKAGIRAIVGYTLMDRAVPGSLKQNPVKTIAECRALSGLFKKNGKERLHFSLNPRFAPACTPGYLKMIAQLAQKEDLYIQTHLSENLFEVSAVKRAFPMIKSYAEVYDRFGLLTEKTLLAHCIHLSPAERELIRKRGCGVVHCPSSNLFLHSGRFPLEHWKYYPKLALGSDIAAGPSFSMLDVMRDGYYANIQKLSGLFYMATLGGAKTLGMGGTIGNLKKGKQADFVVLKTNHTKNASAEDVLSRIIFRSGQVEIKKVFIAGQKVWSQPYKSDGQS